LFNWASFPPHGLDRGEVAERLKAAVLETFRHVYHRPLA
jgi:hypothetical protein